MSKEKIIFGEAKSPGKKRSASELEDQAVLTSFKLIPFIQAAMSIQEATYQEQSPILRNRKSQLIKGVFGDGHGIKISLSTASGCLRQAIYEALGGERETRDVASILTLAMGSAIHHACQRALRGYGLIESPFFMPDRGFFGRSDFLFFNPQAQFWQLVDFKSASSYSFRQVNRKNIPQELRPEKGLYPAKPSHRLQLLIYMGAERERNLDVRTGHVIYINRDRPGEWKESIIFWDAEAEYELGEFLQLVARAREGAERGELPEPTVHPKEAPYRCGLFCDFRGKCEHAKDMIAAADRREKRKRVPRGIRREAKKQREELRKRMKMDQLTLPGLD